MNFRFIAIRQLIADTLTYAVLFLLPWQTRWIFASLMLGGEPWEYGKLSVYATEILVLVAYVFRGPLQVSTSAKKILRCAGLFFLALVLSCVFSIRPELSWGMVIHAAAALILFALLLDERISLMHAAAAFISGLVAPCLLGWFQVLTGTSPASTLFGLAQQTAAVPGTSVIEAGSERLLRAYGSFPHPNVFGGFLAVGSLLLLFGPWKPRRCWVEAVLLALFASTLVVTFSRSAWLAFAVGWLFSVLNNAVPPLSKASPVGNVGLRPRGRLRGVAGEKEFFSRDPSSRRDMLLRMTTFIFCLFVTVLVFHAQIFTRFNPSVRLEAKSIEEREGQYADIPSVLIRNPLTGVGLGAYTVALEQANPGQPTWAYQPIHNVFLLALSETGLVGFFAFLFFLFQCFRTPRSRSFAENAIGFSFILSLLVLTLLDHYLWTSWSGMVLVAFACTFVLRLKED